MTTVTAGDFVRVPCHVQPGAFSVERLITIQSIEGPISGFIGEDELTDVGDSNGHVRARVIAVEDDRIIVRIHGSFFTTNGIASLNHYEPLAA